MNAQPELFDEALARQTDPDTSHEAAASLGGTLCAKLARRVYAVIRSYGEAGCISDDLLKHPSLSDLTYGTITPRYAQLMRKGLVADTGKRRMGVSGRNQRVMVAKEAA